MEERLQKLLSAAGVCSRRTAETYLIAGRVTVNGQTAHLGQRADPDRDEILVDGRPLAPRAEAVYILLNKPRGYVSTLSDERPSTCCIQSTRWKRRITSPYSDRWPARRPGWQPLPTWRGSPSAPPGWRCCGKLPEPRCWQ